MAHAHEKRQHIGKQLPGIQTGSNGQWWMPFKLWIIESRPQGERGTSRDETKAISGKLGDQRWRSRDQSPGPGTEQERRGYAGLEKIQATDEKSRDKEKHGRRRRVLTSPCRWSPTAMGWSPAAPPEKDGQSPSLLAPAYVTRQRSAVSVLRLPIREVPAVTDRPLCFLFLQPPHQVSVSSLLLLSLCCNPLILLSFTHFSFVDRLQWTHTDAIRVASSVLWRLHQFCQVLWLQPDHFVHPLATSATRSSFPLHACGIFQ